MNISNTSFTPANIIFAHAAEAASRVILGESLENIFVLAMRWESQCGQVAVRSALSSSSYMSTDGQQKPPLYRDQDPRCLLDSECS